MELTKTMNFPVVIHKEAASDYGVTVPDLPGCVTAGRTVDEALVMAKEAIEGHLEVMLEEGYRIPAVKTIAQLQSNPEFRDGFWAVVSIDPTVLRVKAVRVNITVPKPTLECIDRVASQRGETRSAFLVRAAQEAMGRVRDIRKPKKGRPPKVTGGRRKTTKAKP
jgi:predicted RNase H-like HicB family nuclease